MVTPITTDTGGRYNRVWRGVAGFDSVLLGCMGQRRKQNEKVIFWSAASGVGDGGSSYDHGTGRYTYQHRTASPRGICRASGCDTVA